MPIILTTEGKQRLPEWFNAVGWWIRGRTTTAHYPDRTGRAFCGRPQSKLTQPATNQRTWGRYPQFWLCSRCMRIIRQRKEEIAINAGIQGD